MKLNLLTIGVVGTMFFASCGGNEKPTENNTEVVADTTTEEATETISYTVNTEESTVNWLGEVAGVYGHNGLISISEGSIETAGENIVGGSITIDMSTINPTDSAYKDEDGHRKEDLVGHLSTGDFFLTDSFPTATFLIKSHAEGVLTGDLTVRGTTKEETVSVTGLNISEEGVTAIGELVFNRQDYGVVFVHPMKDMVLSNDIKINISISATK